MADLQIKLPGRKNTLKVTEGNIAGQQVRLLKLHGEPPTIQHEIARRYARTIPWKNRSSGSLVRHNYAVLVEEVMAIMRRGLEKKEINTIENRNVVRTVRDLCLDHDGLDSSKFETTDGQGMKRDGKAFGNMVIEFFRDLDTVKQMFRDVKQEFEQAATSSST